MSRIVRFDIRGLKRVNRYMVELKGKLDKELTRTNENFIDLTVIDAKNYAPVDTGDMKTSIHKEPVRVGKNVKQWKIVADSPHAQFQEMGFKPHLFFADPLKGFKSNKLGAYEPYFVRKYTPFMAPAFDKNVAKISNELNIAVGRAIK